MASGVPKTDDFWQISNNDYIFTIRRTKFKRNLYFNLDDFLFSIKIDVKSGILPKLFDVLTDLDESLASIIRSLQHIYETVPNSENPMTSYNNHERQIYITFQDTDDESSFVSVNSGENVLMYKYIHFIFTRKFIN